MKNNMTIEEKINKIRNERYEVLSIVSDSIKNNGRIVANDIESIREVIDYDEKCVKRYIAIVKAQELIVSLTEEITFAETEEEIIAIRKKINYYINKVKNELKKRNISEDYLNKYQASVNYLRRDIAKYIRVLRRETNLTELKNLNANYNSLEEEDKAKLKKLINSEARYNQRILNPESTIKKVKTTKTKPITTVTDETIQEKISTPKPKKDNNDIIPPEIVSEINNEEFIFPIKEESTKNRNPIPQNPSNTEMHIVESIDDVSSEDIDYLDLKIKTYDRQYDIRPLYSYDSSFLVRVKNMIKNIPLYKKNKRRIKNMKKDSHRYYSGSDFVSYIAYLTKVNSIKHGLKSVFERSYLSLNETKLLNDHEKCAEWLLKYCKENSLRINSLNRKKVLS